MKNFKMFCFILFIFGFLYGQRESEKDYRVEVVTDKYEYQDYRIEVIKEKYVYKDYEREQPKEVRFISSGGRVTKIIKLGGGIWREKGYWVSRYKYIENFLESKGMLLITESYRKTSYNPGELKDYYVEPGEYWEFKVEVIDKRGVVKFNKTFKTYPGRDETMSYWRGVFSEEGNAVLFYFRDEKDIFHIEVYGIKGDRLASATYEKDLINLKIASDGKIVGAETYKEVDGKWVKHLFFLDVETGRTKLVKAEGEGWRAAGFPSENRKIYLTLYEYPKSFILSFDELPEDLSILFGGEK